MQARSTFTNITPFQIIAVLLLSMHSTHQCRMAQESSRFWTLYDNAYRSIMRRKLGLTGLDEGNADDSLVLKLLEVMQSSGVDFTMTFRNLSLITVSDNERHANGALLP
jgi:serine/tyrosine/threonine adenylyltransferase